MESKPEVKLTPVICESCGYRIEKYDQHADRCDCPKCEKRVDLK